MDEAKIQHIADDISLDNHKSMAPEEIKPYVCRAIQRAAILIDSRYGNKQDIKALVMGAMDTDAEYNIPILVWPHEWDHIYEEAQAVVSNSRLGKTIRPLEIIKEVEEFYDKGFDAGKEIMAWPALSRHYRIAKGEMTIVTGIPGHGKSAFMDAVMHNLAREQKYRFAVFSPENFPYAIHAEKLISLYKNKPFHRGPSERLTRAEIAEGMTWIDEHFRFIAPHEDELHLEAVLGLAQGLIDEEQIDGILIDPYNEIDHNRPQDMSETEYIGHALTKCRRFARRNNVCFWIVAHPSKLYKEKEADEYRPPTPYSISGSAHWYNKSDNCLCVYRQTDNNVMVHIQKIKFKIRGEIGQVQFSYNKPTGKYEEINMEAINALP